MKIVKLITLCTLAYMLPCTTAYASYYDIISNLTLSTPDEYDPFFVDMKTEYQNLPTQDEQTQYIDRLLYDETHEIEAQIHIVQNLLKIVNAQMNENSGWLFNKDTAKAKWLHDQKDKISKKLERLKWQSYSFGYKTAVVTAKYATIYFAIILAAYFVQDEYLKQIGSSEQKQDFASLATLPLEKIIQLAKLFKNPDNTQKNDTDNYSIMQILKLMLTVPTATATTFGKTASDIMHKSYQIIQTELFEKTNKTE